jgi:pyridoxal 5'-phosphate synthase pdxS subunit
VIVLYSNTYKMDSPAILDNDGNLHLPNGTAASGTSTPSAANKAQNAVPLPSRGDATGKGSSVGTGTFGVKVGLAQMLKGGVIMDVMNAEQAKIAEEAGAVAVMALEVSRLPFGK